MKKFTVIICILMLGFVFAGCETQQAKLPAHKLSGISVKIPEDSGILGAYMTATDLALNQVIDNKRKEMPEFISFNFNTNVPLQPSQKELLLKGFESYGVPVDTDGHKAQTVERMSKGVVIAYQDNEELKNAEVDLTVQVEVITKNYGYIYCVYFDVQGGKYIYIGYDDLAIVPYV